MSEKDIKKSSEEHLETDIDNIINISEVDKNEKKNSFFKEWVVPIFAAIGIAILINKFVFYNVYIPSESMVPTINVGDKLMVTRI